MTFVMCTNYLPSLGSLTAKNGGRILEQTICPEHLTTRRNPRCSSIILNTTTRPTKCVPYPSIPIVLLSTWLTASYS